MRCMREPRLKFLCTKNLLTIKQLTTTDMHSMLQMSLAMCQPNQTTRQINEKIRRVIHMLACESSVAPKYG